MLRYAIAFLLLCTPALAQSTNFGLTPCGAAKSLAVTGTTGNVQLDTCAGVAVIWNTGAQTAFVNLGSASNTAATTSSWPIPSKAGIVLNVGRAGLYLAAITSTSTTTLNILQGNGATSITIGQ